ncbi:hypothetical protein, partial [Geodermatophilus maliterrae]
MTSPDPREPGTTDGERTAEAVVRPPVGATRLDGADDGADDRADDHPADGDRAVFARPAGATGSFDPPRRTGPAVP